MLKSLARLCVFVVSALALATPAFSQDDPKFALITSVPAANAGFQWQATSRFAIRIDGTYNWSDESSDYVSTPQILFGTLAPQDRVHLETSTRNTTINLSGIVTIRRIERMRLYVAPRVQFGFSSQRALQTTERIQQSTTTPSGTVVIFGIPSSETTESDQSSTSIGAGGSFGAAGTINDALALFAEFGLTYVRSDAPGTIGSLLATSRTLLESDRSSVNTRAVVGVMFMF